MKYVWFPSHVSAKLCHPDLPKSAPHFTLVGTIAHRKHFYFHTSQTLYFHANFSRSPWREIDDSSRDEWPAIVDAHFHRFSIFEIGHAHQTRQGQGFMRCNQMPRPNFFTKRGITSDQAKKFRFIIPRCLAYFRVMQGMLDRHRLIRLSAHTVAARHISFRAAGAGARNHAANA